jgi:cytochrome c-type biogenesis protein CcmH/NrfG
MRHVSRFGIITTLVLYSATSSFPALSAEQDSSAAFEKGTELLGPYLILADRPSADAATPEARAKINEGIRILTDVAEAKPDNWAAFWFIGKGQQSLGNHVAAEAALNRAHTINPGAPDVGRELMIESICSGHLSAAVAVAQTTARLNSANAGLIANLGLAYLANGQLAQARSAVERALSLEPNDQISRALLFEIKAVERGRTPGHYCPRQP